MLEHASMVLGQECDEQCATAVTRVMEAHLIRENGFACTRCPAKDVDGTLVKAAVENFVQARNARRDAS